MRKEFTSAQLFHAFSEIEGREVQDRLHFMDDLGYILALAMPGSKKRKIKHPLEKEFGRLMAVKGHTHGGHSPIVRGADGTRSMVIADHQVRHRIPADEKQQVVQSLRSMDHIDPSWVTPAPGTVATTISIRMGKEDRQARRHREPVGPMRASDVLGLPGPEDAGSGEEE